MMFRNAEENTFKKSNFPSKLQNTFWSLDVCTTHKRQAMKKFSQ